MADGDESPRNRGGGGSELMGPQREGRKTAEGPAGRTAKNGAGAAGGGATFAEPLGMVEWAKSAHASREIFTPKMDRCVTRWLTHPGKFSRRKWTICDDDYDDDYDDETTSSAAFLPTHPNGRPRYFTPPRLMIVIVLLLEGGESRLRSLAAQERLELPFPSSHRSSFSTVALWLLNEHFTMGIVRCVSI